MSKMLCYNESEFRDKFTDSGESILMDLELHVLSFWQHSFGYLFPSVFQLWLWKSEGHKRKTL